MPSQGKAGSDRYEEKRPRDEGADHHVILEGREFLSVSGVEEVESFDETTIVMRTCKGTLVVRGEDIPHRKAEPGRGRPEGGGDYGCPDL